MVIIVGAPWEYATTWTRVPTKRRSRKDCEAVGRKIRNQIAEENPGKPMLTVTLLGERDVQYMRDENGQTKYPETGGKNRWPTVHRKKETAR